MTGVARDLSTGGYIDNRCRTAYLALSIGLPITIIALISLITVMCGCNIFLMLRTFIINSYKVRCKQHESQFQAPGLTRFLVPQARIARKERSDKIEPIEEKVIRVNLSPPDEYINTLVPANGILQDKSKLPRKVDEERMSSRSALVSTSKQVSEQKAALQGGWGRENK
eukprot:685730-Hanusia_phi.AAC.3